MADKRGDTIEVRDFAENRIEEIERREFRYGSIDSALDSADEGGIHSVLEASYAIFKMAKVNDLNERQRRRLIDSIIRVVKEIDSNSVQPGMALSSLSYLKESASTDTERAGCFRETSDVFYKLLHVQSDAPELSALLEIAVATAPTTDHAAEILASYAINERRKGRDLSVLVSRIDSLEPSNSDAWKLSLWHKYITRDAREVIAYAIAFATRKECRIPSAIILAAALRKLGHPTAIPDVLVSAALIPYPSAVGDNFLALIEDAPEELQLATDGFLFLQNCFVDKCDLSECLSLIPLLRPSEGEALARVSVRFLSERTEDIDGECARIALYLTLNDLPNAEKAAAAAVELLHTIMSGSIGYQIHLSLPPEIPLATQIAALLRASAIENAKPEVQAVCEELTSRGVIERTDSLG